MSTEKERFQVPETAGQGSQHPAKSSSQPGASRLCWFLPFALALPFVAAAVFVALRFGPELGQLFSTAVKMAVVQ